MLHYVRASGQDEAKIRQFLGQFPMSHWSQNLSQYLNASLGGMFLALDDDSTVLGCAALVGERSREMYILGMRMAQGEQSSEASQGLAGVLIEDATQTGAQVVRALIEETDDIPLRVLQEELQFNPQTEWEVGTLSELPVALNRGVGEAGPAWAVDRERLFDFLAKHPGQVWASGDPWFPRTLTEEDLAHGFEVGGAALSPQDLGQPIAALALYSIKNRERLNLGYLQSAKTVDLEALLTYLMVDAHAWGVTELRYGLASDQAQALVEWYGKAAESGWRGWLLEKALHPVVVPS